MTNSVKFLNQKVFNFKDKELACSVEISVKGENYFLRINMDSGDVFSFNHRNIYENYIPSIRDLTRDKIEFSIDSTLNSLSKSLFEKIKDNTYLIEDQASSLEVASSCLSYLKNYPIETIDDYIREARSHSDELVFSNSVLQNGKILSANDRAAISNIIKDNSANFEFPENLKTLIDGLDGKVKFLLRNKNM